MSILRVFSCRVWEMYSISAQTSTVLLTQCGNQVQKLHCLISCKMHLFDGCTVCITFGQESPQLVQDRQAFGKEGEHVLLEVRLHVAWEVLQ